MEWLSKLDNQSGVGEIIQATRVGISGLNQLFELAPAWIVLQDSPHLWAGCTTFTEFLQTHFDEDRSRVYESIRQYRTVVAMGQAGVEIDNAGQAEQISRIPDEHKMAAIELASRMAKTTPSGRMTAKVIRDAGKAVSSSGELKSKLASDPEGAWQEIQIRQNFSQALGLAARLPHHKRQELAQQILAM